MFIKLNHQSLDVYKVVRELTTGVYTLSVKLPADEKFNMIQQIRRAVLSVKLNLAEGSSRKSVTERNRYLEIARGSLVETAVDLKYFSLDELKTAGELLNKCFAMLSNMIKRNG